MTVKTTMGGYYADVVGFNIRLVTVECYRCGVLFAVPDNWDTKRRQDQHEFWCPNGHKQAYVKSSTEIERQRAERAERRAANAEETARAARASVIAMKGVVTKTKKRAAHGVCPVPGCKRSFSNVARHVAGQHPDYAATHDVADLAAHDAVNVCQHGRSSCTRSGPGYTCVGCQRDLAGAV